MGLFSWRQILL